MSSHTMRCLVVLLCVLGVSLVGAQSLALNQYYPCFFPNATQSDFTSAAFGVAYYQVTPPEINSTQRVAQQFTVDSGATWNVTTLRFMIYNTNSKMTATSVSTGFFDFYADSGNLPQESFGTYKLFSQNCQGGAIFQEYGLGSASAFNQQAALYRCDLINPIQLTAGTTYWLVLAPGDNTDSQYGVLYYYTSGTTPSNSLVAAYRGSALPGNNTANFKNPFNKNYPTPLDTWTTTVFSNPGNPLQFCMGLYGNTIVTSSTTAGGTTGMTTGSSGSSADGATSGTNLDSGPAHTLRPFHFWLS
jgi:hypothetical protein